MIDNGSALNVCPFSTLKQTNVDMSRIRVSKTTIRAFDGSWREVNGEIDLLIDVGPCSFCVTFQILEIPNAFRLLQGRPWIHAVDPVLSSLHQKLKSFVEGKLITVNGKEDYAVYKETVVSYISIGEDQNLSFHSFDTISVIRDYGKARRGKHLHRLAAHYKKLSKGIPVPPLSQFFLASPQVIRGTSDSPYTKSNDSSSDTAKALLALLAIYAVVDEISPRIHIHPGQEDEELTNWTTVLLYSAMVADVIQSNPNHKCNDSNSSETRLGKPLPIYFEEGLDEDGRVPKIEESLHRLENHQLTSIEPTEEINIGTAEEPRTLRIETGLDPTQKARMINFLTEYQE
ncbi:hypothetical protein CRG98_037737, partial [Punica granatum]